MKQEDSFLERIRKDIQITHIFTIINLICTAGVFIVVLLLYVIYWR